MHQEIRDFIAWAEACGFRYEGMRKSGHHRIRHTESGRVVTLPHSPSDHRSLLNARALVRRISGAARQSDERHSAARYRYTGGDGPRFTLEAAERDRDRRAARCAVLEAEHDALVDELLDVGRLPRPNLRRAAVLLKRCRSLEDRLHREGHAVQTTAEQALKELMS